MTAYLPQRSGIRKPVIYFIFPFFRTISLCFSTSSEKELLHTLNTEYVGKTLMLISHRASTLTGCDRTLRMEDVAKRSAA